jgi:type 1 glutamine amidotransferase
MNPTHIFSRTVFLTALALSAWAQTPTRVLMLGGSDNSPAHIPTALRDTLAPVLAANNMTLAYRDTQTVLHADSLRQYDVLLLYTADRGTGTAGGSNLTTAQEDALLAWLNAGHVAVAFHGSTNTYLNNPRWLQLLGGRFLDHSPANNSGTETFTRPAHPALTGTAVLPTSAAATGGQPYWDEGRRHQNFASDTVILATANLGTGGIVPWIWVRPQGSGWVYYNASGHDGQVWRRPEFKGQVVQALRWGASIPVRIHVTKKSRPSSVEKQLRILTLNGRTVVTPEKSVLPVIQRK